jgi:predicted dehydrogenase
MLGEFCVVVGAGILGLLSVQMLRLSGIRVIAIDLDDKRLGIANELGVEHAINPLKEDPLNAVENLTGGHGADAVIFAAATDSSEPLSHAFRMCKKKGRVVLVGVVGMDIKREDMYQKELDFLISTSYGPGRYDRNYEEKGLDYPYAYVRWTENRNMLEYLRLVHNGSIRLERLINAVYPIERVSEAFESLTKPGEKPLMVILDYGMPEYEKLAVYSTHERKVYINDTPVKKDVINIALVGAGGFATGIHLPNLKKLKGKYNLCAVMTRTGHKARAVAQQYGAKYATTNFDDILQDENIDLLLIATRHDSHAELTLKALKAGKNVFVEKPLAINQEELNRISEFYEDKIANPKPLLMVGFNRRFSRYAREIKRHTDKRINPLFIHYRMNAGYIPLDSWVHEDGGRIIGEACHIIDLMTFFTESEIESINFESITPKNEKIASSDNKSIILKYKDGSLCTIEYFSVGNKAFPKEYMEVHFDEKTIVLDDYKSLKGYGIKINEISTNTSEKGQLEELETLYEALKNGGKWPIELWDMLQTTEITLVVK